MLEPAHSEALEARDTAALRAVKSECADYEHALSYYRRLAQGRLEILAAEQQRRAQGGSVEDLIADLPRILGGASGRPEPAHARFSDPELPAVELRFPGGEEALVGDDTLAQLPRLDDRQLDATITALRGFEGELSELRRSLHALIDRIERELAARQAAGTVG